MDPPSPCQLDTFLRWTNFQLRAVQFRSPLPPERRILSELSGLSDGVLLSEVCGSLLSLKEPLRVHYQPRVSSRKMENINTCLALMRQHGVRLPTIGAEEILRGDLLALTGVIWSLVVRFQLSGDARRAGSKKSVLLWTRAVLSNENIPDLATSWRNGMFLSKLISYLTPTAHSALDPSNHGMLISTAKRELGVEDILSADSLRILDEESLATYLSLFLVAMAASLLAWLRGLLGSSAPKGLSPEDWRNGDLLGRLVRAKCPDSKEALRDLSEMFTLLRDRLDIAPAVTAREMREGRVDQISLQTFLLQIKHSSRESRSISCSVSGGGVESAQVGVTSFFSVDTRSAGAGVLSVDIKYSNGDKLTHSVSEENRVYQVSYIPVRPGLIFIDVKLSGEHIPKSPCRILATDIGVVKLLDKENVLKELQVSKQHEVLVGAEGAGEGKLTGHVTYPDGSSADLQCVKKENGSHSILITPQNEGDFLLHILWNGSPIPESPFKLSALLPPSYRLDTTVPPRDPETGDLLGVKIGDAVCLRVRSDGGRLSQLTAEVRHTQTGAPLSVAQETHRNYSNVWLTPVRTGVYKIQLFAGEIPVTGSPVLLPVSDAAQLILVSPPALPTCLQISCPMELTLTAESAGPAQLTFYCERGIDCTIFRSEDSIVATLLPGSIGEFVCSLKWGSEHIPNSPFRVTVCDIRQVSVTGEVLEGELGAVGEELEFIILYELAGVSHTNDVTLNVSARGPTADYIVSTQDEGLGHTAATFTPWEPGEHQLEIFLGDIEIENSPFYFDVVSGDSMSTNAYGTGLQRANSGAVSEFYIRTKQSDVLEGGRLGVRVHSMHGEVQHWLVERGEGDYRVEYTPKRPGAYLVDIQMDGEHISGSPFKVSVHQDNQAGEKECLLSGPALNPEMKFTLGQPVDFTVDATRSPPGQLSVSADCEESSLSARVIMHQYRQGFYQVNIDPPDVGLYSVSVRYGAHQSADSPFLVEIVPSDTDSTRCRAYGPGLSEALVGERSEFFVSTQGAGRGALSVSVEGSKNSFVVYVDPTPEDSKLLCCRFKPRVSGSYWIALKWSGQHIPGSPYRLEIKGDAARGSGASLPDSLADSLRQTLIPEPTEGYESSEEEVTPAPPPVVTPVRNVARVAEKTPTPPKGSVMAHISHFEKQASADDTVTPRRPGEGWKYLRATFENKRESQLEPKMPVIAEGAVDKVAQDRGVNKVAEDRAPLENVARGVVSSLVKKSEQLQLERNTFDSPSLRNLKQGAVRRTREQLTEPTTKQPAPAVKPSQDPATAEPAKNVAINRKEKARAKRSADRSKSKSESRELEEERIRKKTEKRNKGKKIGDAAEKNVSFSSEVATRHIPKDKQRTGLFGMFDKKETRVRRPVITHRTIPAGSVPASIHQQQKAMAKFQQYSNPYLANPYGQQAMPAYYPPYAPMPQYVPVQMYPPAPAPYQPPAQPQTARKAPPGHYMDNFAEQTNLFY